MHIQVTVSIGFETYISHAGEAARFTLSSTLLQTNVMKVEHHKFPKKKTWILIFNICHFDRWWSLQTGDFLPKTKTGQKTPETLDLPSHLRNMAENHIFHSSNMADNMAWHLHLPLYTSNMAGHNTENDGSHSTAVEVWMFLRLPSLSLSI